MRFPDLATAGRQLAFAVAPVVRDEEAIVLGVARGGVPVAREVAREIRAPLDVVLVQPLFVVDSAGPLCAFSVAGVSVVDEHAFDEAARLEVEDIFFRPALSALAERVASCRDARSPLQLAGRVVVLVDDGVRSGVTMRAAVRAVRRVEAQRIVIAVPIAAPETRPSLVEAADELVCLGFPDPFPNVAAFYQDFSIPDDAAIRRLLS